MCHYHCLVLLHVAWYRWRQTGFYTLAFLKWSLRVKRTGLCLGAFNPSNSFLLGAGVVFASALPWHISRCFHLDGSVYDFRSIFPFYPTSSGDADGKLSMTIKMFALYIRRNDFTLSTYVLRDASLSITSFPFPALDFIYLRPSFLSFYLVNLETWLNGTSTSSGQTN